MRRPPYLQGPAREFRGVAFLGLFVLAGTCYVACGGSDRSYGTGGKGDSSSPGNSGGTGGTSMSGSGGGHVGGGTGAGGGANGGAGGVGRGGAGGVGTAGRGSGARDAADDGPISNAN